MKNNIISIKMNPNGEIYDFYCRAFILKIGDHVILETDDGFKLGIVHASPVLTKKIRIAKNYKILRKAIKKDLLQLNKNKELERKAYSYCFYNINNFGLDMNLFAVESTFDMNQLTFFFTANGKVDFRKLVKTLVKQFHVKIEMKQVGVRNQAKICGGIGRCGQILCCSSFLKKFNPVSIKMAKRQGLSLNPSKISGQCGRLMCCLTFEDTSYKKNKSIKIKKY